jgi:hypothetical protein
LGYFYIHLDFTTAVFANRFLNCFTREGPLNNNTKI